MDPPPTNHRSTINRNFHEVIAITKDYFTRSVALRENRLPAIPQPNTGTTMHPSRFDPRYVQISLLDAAEILGITPEELHQRQQTDKRCPTGFKDREYWMGAIKFRLADVYAYSELIMKTSNPAYVDRLVNSD